MEDEVEEVDGGRGGGREDGQYMCMNEVGLMLLVLATILPQFRHICLHFATILPHLPFSATFPPQLPFSPQSRHNPATIRTQSHNRLTFALILPHFRFSSHFCHAHTNSLLAPYFCHI